jgi:hypothetical protein
LSTGSEPDHPVLADELTSMFVLQACIRHAVSPLLAVATGCRGCSISEHYKLPDTRFGLAEGPHQSGLIVTMQHPCACNQAPNPEQLGEKAKRQAVTHPPKLAAAFR